MGEHCCRVGSGEVRQHSGGKKMGMGQRMPLSSPLAHLSPFFPLLSRENCGGSRGGSQRGGPLGFHAQGQLS